MRNLDVSAPHFNRGPVASRNNQPALALDYAGDGVPVFPVSPHTKAPYPGSRGFHDATTDAAQIRDWWNREPSALVAAPTGPASGFWVLDIDAGGHSAFADLLALLGCDGLEDLTGAWTVTPRAGLHCYFRFEPGTSPRTRAGDIAGNIDTRGIGGSIILPGNALPDGRSYRWAGPVSSVHDAPSAPKGLLWLATFNTRERQHITDTPDLLAALKTAPATDWAAIFERWRQDEAQRIAQRCGPCADDEGMRRQALHDLSITAREYAEMQDGRRNKLFSLACRCARYVAHHVLTEAEFRAALLDAAKANGALAKHGSAWAESAIRRALVAGSRDQLPPLARAFRSGGAA
jgi:hypothetical protein